jgi:inhibitor of cysteine peptidase
MLKRLGATLMIIGLIGLGGCGARTPQTIEVRAQDGGRTIELQRGDHLRVLLEGNPSTGYEWLRVDEDSAVLTSAGEPTFKADATMPGSPGMATLMFDAAAPGQATLTLHYRRSWEPDPPAETFTITVLVSEAEG